HTRSRYLILSTALLLAEGPVHAVKGARLPNGSDAVAHPELIHIFSGRSLGYAAGVGMHINKAGQQVHALGLQYFRIFISLSAAFFIYRHTRIAYRLDGSNTVAFNYYIHRALRGRAGAIYQHHAADDESVKGTPAHTSLRGLLDLCLSC